MGSTGEADRKRRHLSSISSPTTPTANPKKQNFLPLSEDKKLDAAVLQYQNQQLVQKLEAQKVEYASLDNQFSSLKERQQPHDRTLSVVKKSWEELVSNLEACSTCARDSSCDKHRDSLSTADDGTSSSLKDVLLSRLIETGATETSSTINPDEMDEDREVMCTKIKNIISNVIAAIDQLWHLKDSYTLAVLNALPEDVSCKQICDDLKNDVKNKRSALNDLHLKHKSLVRDLQNHCDTEAKDKTELKRLRGEFETTVAELKESNYKLASLKAEKDATKGAFFPVLSVGSKSVSGDKVRDKQKDLQDMESRLKELLDQASARLLDIKGLHEDRKGILKKLSTLQNTVKNVKCISSSQAYLLVRDQLSKSKAEVAHYQAIYEKLQAEKDNLAWREKEVNLKNELVDIFRRSSTVAEYRVKELGLEIQKVIDLRNAIQSRLEEAAREPGRQEIISEFKALVSSFPEDMSVMQLQLSKYKESASNVHSLRADVQSLSAVLDRKTKELGTLYTRSADQVAELKKLQSALQDLSMSYQELSVILEMYRRESPESSDILEAMDLEYKALSHVQSLKSSLDEHNLELRVKKAIEAEAISQQRLAAAEAEIADLRQSLEASNRDISNLSDVLKSKSEENEAYLAEIESIGQAYDDMQTQNQHLLQQITERDDYNIKLVLEGVKARQLHDSLHVEKQSLEKETQRQNASLEFYNMKAGRIEDQLKLCSDQVKKLSEDRMHKSTILDNMQKRLLDVKRLSQQARDTIQGSQSKLDSSRSSLAEVHIELDRERFDKKRLEEELEAARRKMSRLKAEREGSLIDKLQVELREYRELLKCGACHDRAKEVVITKCYHLFCHQCIQRIIGTRHRKCPSCAASFSPNDVKPVYI